jgi:hypothetical protein
VLQQDSLQNVSAQGTKQPQQGGIAHVVRTASNMANEPHKDDSEAK